MTLTRSLMFSLALFAGTSIGCNHNKGGRNGMPSATGGPTAQNDDMNRTSNSADVGNGTDASGNGSTTPDPQATQGPPCNNATDTGRAGNPNCDNGGTSGTNTNADSTRINGSSGPVLTTPDPKPDQR